MTLTWMISASATSSTPAYWPLSGSKEMKPPPATTPASIAMPSPFGGLKLIAEIGGAEVAAVIGKREQALARRGDRPRPGMGPSVRPSAAEISSGMPAPLTPADEVQRRKVTGPRFEMQRQVDLELRAAVDVDAGVGRPSGLEIEIPPRRARRRARWRGSRRRCDVSMTTLPPVICGLDQRVHDGLSGRRVHRDGQPHPERE